jgi:ZIP family zinc transporter
VSPAQTALLGAIAGLTIFLGLPLGRVRTKNPKTRTFLNGLSAGILVFLLTDIVENAQMPIERALTLARDGGSWGPLVGNFLIFALGLAVGLLGLLYVSRAWRRSPKASMGPGAMAVVEASPAARERQALTLGMSIAAGIGLHNFSEGLAIGQASHTGEISLAVLLVIGFGLHNATEGFGIVGPLAAAEVRPSWKWLALAGLIGGGPTFLGTVLGGMVTSTYVFVAFLAMAAGAIIYVIGELFSAGRRLSWEITLWGILAGFLLGLATELIVVAAGA